MTNLEDEPFDVDQMLHILKDSPQTLVTFRQALALRKAGHTGELNVLGAPAADLPKDGRKENEGTDFSGNQ